MAPSSRAQPIGSIYSLELRTPNVTVSANQYPQEGPTKYERYMISPGIGKNGGTGAGQHDTQKQTTNLGGLTYRKTSSEIAAMVGSPNRDSSGAARYSGHAWRQLWSMNGARRLCRPSLRFDQKVSRTSYNANSDSEMIEMKELQADDAEASYKRSKLGRLPREILNIILANVLGRDQISTGHRWAPVESDRASVNGLLHSCRYLYAVLKPMVNDGALFHFRTADAVILFIEFQKLSPMVQSRSVCLGAVILHVRPYGYRHGKVYKSHLPLPTIDDEQNTMIEPGTSGNPFYHPNFHRPGIFHSAVTILDWQRAVGYLIREFGIKILGICSEGGYLPNLWDCDSLIRDLTARECCVENMIEFGHKSVTKWVLGEPGTAMPLQPSF